MWRSLRKGFASAVGIWMGIGCPVASVALHLKEKPRSGGARLSAVPNQGQTGSYCCYPASVNGVLSTTISTM
jgi:hypothetical protein